MRKRVGRGVLVLLCLSLIYGRGTAAAQSGPAYELVKAVNQFRAQHGLPALQVDSALMAAAQRHVTWMAANHHYSHTGEGGSTPQSRANATGYAGTVYENIQGGTDLTAQQAVYWWQQDSIHLTTMLLPRHTHIGVGFAANDDQKLLVLMIGQPSKAIPAARSVTPARGKSRTSQPPIPMAPILVSTPRADGAIIHLVQQGQTAWAIAARYGITLADLLKLNNLPSGAVLHPGDSILIRPGGGPDSVPTQPTTYVVRPGDTIWTIAARSGIPVDDLLTLNQMTRGAILRPGDRLILRQAAPTMTPLPTITPTSPTTITPAIEPTSEMAATVVLVMPSTVPTTAIPSSYSPSPTAPTPAAVPTLPPTSNNDVQSDQLPFLLPGILIAGIALAAVAMGTALISHRRR